MLAVSGATNMDADTDDAGVTGPDRVTDTIIALASGAGRAGVAVIRVSGPGALGVLSALSDGPLPKPRRAVVRRLGYDQHYLDEAMAVVMPGPESYTGEDVVELHVHGGPAIIDAVLGAAMKTRLCRMAEPGEFTRRAFDNGRMDLTQAEAIGDLIDAETEGQRRQAARLYQGEAARTFEGWRGQLMGAMAALEAGIDFPDEADVPEDVYMRALAPIETLAADLEQALGDSGRLRAVREGFRVAILGPPNAGKSSLINALARREAAIVSELPGTTRDIVEVRLVLAGFPVWIADTAGLRETADAIEAEGVRRALARAEDADLRIWVRDASLGVETTTRDVSRETSPRPGDLIVLNKIDQTATAPREPGAHAVSAKTGAGIADLERRLTAIVRERLETEEAPLVTRARHRGLVEEALGHLERAIEGARIGVGPELLAEDLRMAARALGRITGAVDAEDLLDLIFGEFCIGK